MEKTTYKELLGKEIVKNQELTNVLLVAVEVMENAAKETRDEETFKKLTIGFNDVKEKLNESGRSRQK